MGCMPPHSYMTNFLLRRDEWELGNVCFERGLILQHHRFFLHSELFLSGLDRVSPSSSRAFLLRVPAVSLFPRDLHVLFVVVALLSEIVWARCLLGVCVV